MSEEILQPTPINEPEQEPPIEPQTEEKPSLVPGFKSVCVRLGLMMIVIFGARILATVCSLPLADWIQTLDTLPLYLFNAAYSIFFLYVIPVVATVFILKHPLKNSPNRVYQKPKYFGKAMAMFPAGYGLAMATRLLTILLSMLFAGTALSDSFNVVQESLFSAPDMATAVIQFVQLAVIAPIVEELWFRGMVMESLRPYGNGFAIFVSAILFGLTHANFEQFFYAAALGVFLGYIAIATESIVTTTVMHAIFNSISGFMLLLSADKGVQDYLLASQSGEKGVITTGVVLYFVLMGVMVLLLIVGIIMMIYKFLKIKKYKVPKMQTEISAKKRWGIFFTRAAVIVGLVLAAVCFAEPAIISVIKEKFINAAAILLQLK